MCLSVRRGPLCLVWAITEVTPTCINGDYVLISLRRFTLLVIMLMGSAGAHKLLLRYGHETSSALPEPSHPPCSKSSHTATRYSLSDIAVHPLVNCIPYASTVITLGLMQVIT